MLLDAVYKPSSGTMQLKMIMRFHMVYCLAGVIISRAKQKEHNEQGITKTSLMAFNNSQ